MFRPLLAVALLTVPAATLAQANQAERGKPPQRIRNVTVGKGQKCPPASSPDEVVVCQTLDEPYRIPRALRDEGPVSAANQSWTNRAASVDQTSRVAAGLPDTCSPIGTGGQSGCALQANQAYAAERRANARAASSVPGGGE